MENNSRKKKNGYDWILLMVLILLLIIIFFLIYKIGDYMIDETRSVIFSKQLQKSVLIIDTDGTESVKTDSVSDAEQMEEIPETNDLEEQDIIPSAVDFESLYEMSSDAVAWLYDPGMTINYPVAQAGDNDYYLKRNLSGESSKSGTLFMDYRNSADFSDWNTLIYGHNMKSGTMFASLLNYRTPGYYEEHPIMYLYVPDMRYKVELILAYTTKVDDVIFQLSASREEQEAGLERAYRLSNFESNIQPDKNDKFVTFVTCSYAYDDARYVVIGRLVEE